MTLKHPSSVKLRRDVGRRVAELRVERGWTQDRLASKLDVGARYLQRIEAGDINLTLDSLLRLAVALRVSLVDLLRSPD